MATGSGNVAVGANTLQGNGSGSNNVAVGLSALQEGSVPGTATGSFNTAVGQFALGSNQSGNNNTAVGADAGVQVSTGANNIFVGFEAGANIKNGNQNIYVGNGPISGNDESSVIRIGSQGDQTRTFIAGISNSIVSGSAVLIDPTTGQLGSSFSSERYKQDIRNMADASDMLMQLRPVTFHYKQSRQDGAQRLQYGLIAEEISKFYPDLVVYGMNGQVESIEYHELPALILNEVQKQHRTIESQQTRIDEQAEIIKAMRARISNLERMIHVQASADHLPDK